MSARTKKDTSRHNSSSAARSDSGDKPARREEFERAANGTRDCVDCRIEGGLPTVRGKARAHYRTGQAGQAMLVIDRRPGERIRINATTEIVILEIDADHVKIAVETTPAAEEKREA